MLWLARTQKCDFKLYGHISLKLHFKCFAYKCRRRCFYPQIYGNHFSLWLYGGRNCMPIGQTLFLPPFDPLWFLVTHVKDLVNWPSIFKSHWMKEGVYEAFPSNIGRTKGYEDPELLICNFWRWQLSSSSKSTKRYQLSLKVSCMVVHHLPDAIQSMQGSGVMAPYKLWPFL